VQLDRAKAFGDGWLLAVGSLMLLVFAYALFKLKWHPVLVSAQVVTSFIVLTWFSKPGQRQWNLRFALSAVVLVLSAALSPELIIGALAFLYFIFGAIALWDYYLLRFEAGESDVSKASHKRGLFFTLTLVVLLVSLLMFPFLPRPQKKWQAQLGAGWARIGLSGSVELNSDFKTRSKDNSVAFRVVMPSQVTNRALIESQSDLWRGRTLEVLSDTGWYLRASSANAETIEIATDNELPDPTALDVLREPSSLNIVSAPYGTTRVSMRNSQNPVLKNEVTGDYRLTRSLPDWLKYTVNIEKPKPTKATLSPSLLKVPQGLNLKQAKWSEWLQQGRALKTPEEKTALVTKLFSSHGLEWSIASDRTEGLGPRQQLERFLFETKKGHCEFFATAAALLLRNWGVPTRLVTGYRSNQGFKENILVVYESEAHAWLEVVNSQGRWASFDPTPAARPNALPILWDYMSTLKNRLETGWYLYVLEFDAARALKTLKEFLKTFASQLMAVAGLLVVALIARWIGRRRPLRLINGQRDRRSTPLPVRRMAQWIIDLEHRKRIVVERAPKPRDFEAWFADFQRLRFAKERVSPIEVQMIYRQWKQSRRDWQKSIQ
jgi:hypothetical protein